jgi:hypothetical protein
MPQFYQPLSHLQANLLYVLLQAFQQLQVAHVLPSIKAHLPLSNNHPATLPQKFKLPWPCPLNEFCFLYDTSKCDAAQLKKLEVIPGNQGVEKLGEKHWGAVGSTELLWGRFLEAHSEFVTTAKNGTWV